MSLIFIQSFKERIGEDSSHSRPSWNRSFTAIIHILRAASSAVPRNINAVRMLTDHAIPKWLPTLPSGVTCSASKIPPGEWFFPTIKGLHLRQHSDPLIMKDGKYILYFHGGAFCCCNSSTHRGLLLRLASHTGASILSVDYRRPPENPFPIPVNDCVSAYLYILEKVGSASRIIFAGDSAGGNLVLSTLLQIHDAGLDMPNGALLLSPWVDLTDIGGTQSWQRNSSYDYIPPDLAELFVECYTGREYLSRDITPTINKPEDVTLTINKPEDVPLDSRQEDTTNKDEIDNKTPSATLEVSLPHSPLSLRDLYRRDLSPTFSLNLHALPPLHVEFGECEVLHDQIADFCRKATDAGVEITSCAREDMVHVFPIYSFSGMKQIEDSFDAMVEFINRRLSTTA
jgi:acetyl esterase/lipase